MKKLVWPRLKKMRCPSCNGGVTATPDGGVKCNEPREKCGFTMGRAAFETTIASLYKPKGSPPEADNQQLLNNL